MEKLFITGKYRGKLEISKKIISKLPNKLVLALPIQFLDFKEQIKSELEKEGKKVTFFQSKHGQHPGQILGCDVQKFSGDCEVFFYVGDGKFHPTALLYKNKKPVFCYNPFNEKLEVLKKLEKVEKRKKGQLAKFFSSDNIGVLVSTKPGQNNSKKAEELRTQLEKKGKKVFVFLADNVDFNSLENFNFVDVWVNTACPRIVENFKCLNFDDLTEFL